MDMAQRDAVRENDGPAIISKWAIDNTTFLNGGLGQKTHKKYLILGHRLMAGKCLNGMKQ